MGIFRLQGKAAISQEAPSEPAHPTWAAQPPTRRDIIDATIDPPPNDTRLPVYHFVPVAHHPDQMKAAAASQPAFFRTVRVDVPSHPRFMNFNLAELLMNHGDRQLYRIARHCGATVVGHEWALTQRDLQPVYYKPPQPSLVPAGYLLVARVDAIKDISPLTPKQESQIRTGLRDYAAESGTDGLSDQRPGQFVFGRTAESDEGLHLVDIDIRSY